MKRALLEVVASGAVVEPSDVERFIRCTLLSALNDYEVSVGGTEHSAARPGLLQIRAGRKSWQRFCNPAHDLPEPAAPSCP